MKRARLAVVITHPIQYYAPVFRVLAGSSLDLRVFHTGPQPQPGGQFDSGFGQRVEWDVPLLDGYASEFVPNAAGQPSLEAYGGLRNPELNPRIARWGANAVLVFGWNHHSHLQAMRHFKGRIPVLFRGDSTLLDPQPGWKRLARRALLHWIYRHVDLALAVGCNSRDYFHWCGLCEHQVAVAPHCVDNARFANATAPQVAQAEAWRRESGAADHDVVVVFAGKFQAKKDPAMLLQAVAGLDGAARLLMFGSGELEPALRAQTGMNPAIAFLPFVNQGQMPAVYRAGDLFVLPSRGPGETWGLALNEAMASGRAVIASDRVGGARDLIDEGVNGWTFTAGGQAALAATLAAAVRLGRPGLAAMGARGQARIAAWSVEACAAAIEAAVLAQVRR